LKASSAQWGRVLLFVAGSVLLLFGAHSVLGASYWDGEFHPAHADAFYHGRRILDAVMSGQPVIQFDPRIHMPEGSWLTWPWGFDQCLASITSLFGPFATEQEAARVLFQLPLAFAPVAIGLMVWLTWQLGLSTPMSAMAVLSYAAVPVMTFQYAPGNVDHHFAEQLWVLLLLNGAVWLLRRPESRAAPLFLGTVLGTGVAIQNGLFILPVMLVLAMGVAWLRGLPLPARARLDTLAATLILVTLAVCVPSQLWRMGEFGFYVLSWFHVYVALVCAAYMAWMARARPSWRSVGLMAAVGGVALAAAYVPVAGGMTFATGNFAAIGDILEAKSPYRVYREMGAQFSTVQLSWLMWFMMPALLASAWWVLRSSSPRRVVFAVISGVVLALMQMQTRFAVMGMMSLVIVFPLLADDLSVRRPELRKKISLLAALAMVICFLPVRTWFRGVWVPGSSVSYASLRPELKTLGEACSTQAGTVLALQDAGHWITYHTKCSVLADVFILTPQHVAKIAEVNQLMATMPDQLRATRPDIRYVLVNIDPRNIPMMGLWQPTEAQIQAVLPSQWPLVRELLRPDRPLPQGYRVVKDALSAKGGLYARVLEIER
jgi:hypothetical protein